MEWGEADVPQAVGLFAGELLFEHTARHARQGDEYPAIIEFFERGQAPHAPDRAQLYGFTEGRFLARSLGLHQAQYAIARDSIVATRKIPRFEYGERQADARQHDCAPQREHGHAAR